MMNKNIHNEQHDHHHRMENEPIEQGQGGSRTPADFHMKPDSHTSHHGHEEPVALMDQESHAGHRTHLGQADHALGSAQVEHMSHDTHVDHTGHEKMFRQKFWISLLLSIPVLLFSPAIQEWLGYSLPEFSGSQWIAPFFAVIVFFYGGLPFLRMAIPEFRNRQPGIMTLISLAISVAFVYSLADRKSTR